ncbi:MAG TPA: hypothetical protein ACYCC3_00415 [Candidatus Azoamicus sp.]
MHDDGDEIEFDAICEAADRLRYDLNNNDHTIIIYKSIPAKCVANSVLANLLLSLLRTYDIKAEICRN